MTVIVSPSTMAGSDPLPDHWLVVLRTVASACAGDRSESVPTPRVARDLRDQAPEAAASARTLLRALRRHGYLDSPRETGGGPARWAPTRKGLAYLDGRG